MSEEKVQHAARRDGVVISVGQRVTTNYSPHCDGRVFIVEEIIKWPTCESGFMVMVHLEHEPARKLKGVGGVGLDTNWFKIYQCEAPQ